MKAKLLTKRTELRRFSLTNFLYIIDVPPNCAKCFKPINNENYAFMCMDLNKIWHDSCWDSKHMSSGHITNEGYGVMAHSDKLVLVKIITKDAYDMFQLPEFELKV